MKMTMAMKTVFAILAILATIGVAPAPADMLTYSVVANNGGANYASGAGGSFQLSQFDSELGTLQSVVVIITGFSLGGEISVDNEWSAAGKVQLQLGVDLVVTTPDWSELYFTPMQTSALTSLAADEDDDPDFLGADSFTLSGSTRSETQYDNPVNLAAYTGSGLMTYSFYGEGFANVMGLSPLDVPGRVAEDSSLPFYSLLAQITYDYTPLGGGGNQGGGGGGGAVPEPGTLGMGLALAGLSLSKWGRSRLAVWRARRSATIGSPQG
jgi:hypothetical protein